MAKTQSVKRLKITQLKSGIGFDRKQRLALMGLGLRRIRHSVEVVDTPETRGLILKVVRNHTAIRSLNFNRPRRMRALIVPSGCPS